MTPQTIGTAMRSARVSRCITRTHLSAVSGVPYSSLTKAERGECCLSVLSLVPLAAVLGITIDSYIGADNIFPHGGEIEK